MTGELEGQVALVTGGGWNVGRGVALAMGRAGARVAVAARSAERLEEVAAEIRAAGGEALAVPMDATRPDEVAAGVERIAREWGPVDVLAALAGGGMGLGPIDESDPDAWWDVVAQNLRSSHLTARAVLPGMRARGAGAIVFCSGGGAFFPNVGIASTAYACAKAAVCRLTDQLAVELMGTGIRVNCLEPGNAGSPEDRAEHPDQHTTPEQSGELAVWLASSASEPLSARIVTVYDTWWRDPATVRAVSESYHRYCLRRVEE